MNYYTYTIYFVDGHYYHGYAKYRGESPLTDGYFGSPITHKEKWLTTMHWKEITGVYETQEAVSFAEQESIRPVFREDPFCLNVNCGGVIDPERARVGATKSGRLAGERSKINKTGVCDPVNSEKGRQTQRELGIGFCDPDFQQSELMKKNRKQNGIKSGAIAASTGQIDRARACIDKRNQSRAGRENIKKAHAKQKKPIEVTTPEGDKLWFGSLTEASTTLKIDPKQLSLAARKLIKSVKGHTASFLNRG